MTPVVVSSVPARTSAQLLGALLVQQRHEVTAVVHGDVRVRVGRRVEVLVVGLVVLATDGVAADAVLGHERCGHVVLGRERVGGHERDLGTAGLERAHEVGRLGGDVQAGGDAQAVERLLPLEALADEAQDRHLPFRPLDTTNTFVHETEVGDIVGWIGRGLAVGGVTGGGLHRVLGRGGIGHPFLLRSETRARMGPTMLSQSERFRGARGAPRTRCARDSRGRGRPPAPAGCRRAR